MSFHETAPTPEGTGVHLLLVLEALITGDPRPTGLSGVVCLGIRHSGGETWWRARFDPRQPAAKTEFLSGPPTDGDVCVLLGDREATTFMKTGAFPDDATTIECTGDVRLFRRMTDHYTQTQSATQLRSRQSKGTRPS